MLYTGPYGNPMVSAFDPETYSVYIIVAGGIGCTPMQAWLSELLEQHRSKKRSIVKVFYIWILKDKDVYIANAMASSGVLMPPSEEERDVFNVDVYLTGKSKTSTEYAPAEIDMEAFGSKTPINFKFGRPKMEDYFLKASEIAFNNKLDKICVAGCGPAALTSQLTDLCKSSLIKFDLHLESFDF
jgi:predicted ferric reductase